MCRDMLSALIQPNEAKMVKQHFRAQTDNRPKKISNSGVHEGKEIEESAVTMLVISLQGRGAHKATATTGNCCNKTIKAW